MPLPIFRLSGASSPVLSQIRIWLIQWGLHIFRQFPPTAVLSALLAVILSVFRTLAALWLEIIALRHQLGVLQRSVKRPQLNRFDRFLWAWFCRAWDEWRSALCIVKPETVIAWHPHLTDRFSSRLAWEQFRKHIRKLMAPHLPLVSAGRSAEDMVDSAALQFLHQVQMTVESRDVRAAADPKQPQFLIQRGVLQDSGKLVI